jgi:SNF2 family DNA or RNA helicase
MQLLASGVDVIVCSYQFAESNGRELSALQAKVEEYCNDPNGKTPQPSRPTSALHSPFWETTEHMWKLVVLDEAQLVNKREKIRHKAIKKGIPAKAYIIMSGTLAHNKWHNMSGYVDFLQGHPFTTHTKFLHTFSSFSTTGNIQAPHISRIRLLQRFLQAFLIAVPASVLNLQNVVRNRVEFPLTPADKQKVDALTLEYRIASQAGATDTVEFGNAGQEQDTGNALSFAVMAQLAASHPLILRATMENRIKARGTIDRESGEVQISVQEDLGGAQRDEWLKKVKESTNLIEESGRVTWFIKLFKWLRGKYPDEKIVVFSTYLKFLDILAEALRRAYNIVAVRYDGSVLPSKRTNVERVFQLCSPEIPLLITAGAGKSSLLNIPIM